MFDTLLASKVSHRPQVRSSLMALSLHVAGALAAMGATARSGAMFQPPVRDTIRLDLTRLRAPEHRRSDRTAPLGQSPLTPAPPLPPLAAPSGVPPLDLRSAESPLDLRALTELAPDSGGTVGSPAAVVGMPTDVDVLPLLTSPLQPHYPEVLRRTGVSGEVLLEYVVGSTGRVDSSSVRIVRSSHPGFSSAALQALAGARFRPALRSGRPAAVRVQQTIRFEIR
jgi:protein TonB